MENVNLKSLKILNKKIKFNLFGKEIYFKSKKTRRDIILSFLYGIKNTVLIKILKDYFLESINEDYIFNISELFSIDEIKLNYKKDDELIEKLGNSELKNINNKWEIFDNLNDLTDSNYYDDNNNEEYFEFSDELQNKILNIILNEENINLNTYLDLKEELEYSIELEDEYLLGFFLHSNFILGNNFYKDNKVLNEILNKNKKTINLNLNKKKNNLVNGYLSIEENDFYQYKLNSITKKIKLDKELKDLNDYFGSMILKVKDNLIEYFIVKEIIEKGNEKDLKEIKELINYLIIFLFLYFLKNNNIYEIEFESYFFDLIKIFFENDLKYHISTIKELKNEGSDSKNLFFSIIIENILIKNIL